MVSIRTMPPLGTQDALNAFLRQSIEALPARERAFFATRMAASLLETAGYEAARCPDPDHVTKLMRLAAEADRLAGLLPSDRVLN